MCGVWDSLISEFQEKMVLLPYYTFQDWMIAVTNSKLSSVEALMLKRI